MQPAISSTDDVRLEIQKDSTEGQDNDQNEGIIEVVVENMPSTVALQVSETDSSPSLCRICHESSEETSKLLKPCKCNGSMEFVHFHCLKEWIESSHNDVCSVCMTKYDGLIMTASAPSLRTFLADNPIFMKELRQIVYDVVVGVYILLSGAILSEHPWFNDRRIFRFLFLLIYGFVFARVWFVVYSYSQALLKLYRNYNRIHTSFKVSRFEKRVTKTAIELEAAKGDTEVAMNDQNEETVNESLLS